MSAMKPWRNAASWIPAGLARQGSQRSSCGSFRYPLLVLGVMFFLHAILSFTREEYGRATSISNIAACINRPQTAGRESPIPDYYFTPANFTPIEDRRANASFVILARNSDLDGTVRSVREVEDRFNKKYRYPYVLLNDEPFTEQFKTRITVLTEAVVEFGVIPHDHWSQPAWIDDVKANASRAKMEEDGIIYGGSLPYRNMCRFNSGFFFKHELLQKYRWYWRVEPDVHFHCDINFDPFLFMQDNNKLYGFTHALYEIGATIPSLWQHVTDFAKKRPEFVAPGNSMDFVSDNAGMDYNNCHFWSNFEIADMNMWRGPAYTAFFDYLDSTGGFYYERWGDAPVHSIFAALFTRRDQIHFFNEIGYEHAGLTHCPQGEEVWRRGKCTCGPDKNFDYTDFSCMKKWDRLMT
ncbi:glycosyltransferase family 15 protein [Infundibulicybe gibba]|nr:glycosyltransferase family 15 protein [Infundibulicybe gibba]